MPTYSRDMCTYSDVVLLNHALVVIPHANPGKMKNNGSILRMKPAATSYPLASIVAVIDLGICSGNSFEILSENTSDEYSSNMGKKKKRFKMMRNAAMQKVRYVFCHR
eukprot:5283234-Ditylum_brightwellii.AAC.1